MSKEGQEAWLPWLEATQGSKTERISCPMCLTSSTYPAGSEPLVELRQAPSVPWGVTTLGGDAQILGMTDTDQLYLAGVGVSRRPAWRRLHPGAGGDREVKGQQWSIEE